LQAAAPFVRDIRVVDNTTIAIDPGPRFGGFRAAAQPADATARLVIDLVGAQTDSRRRRRRSRPRPQPPPEVPPALTPPASAIRTIAIDPGTAAKTTACAARRGRRKRIWRSPSRAASRA
jgi:hypothetical protein